MNTKAADALLLSGLALIGVALYFVFPAILPYYVLILGLVALALGCLGVVKGRRK